MSDAKAKLSALTADIVSAHVGNNRVAIGDLPRLIANVYDALVAMVTSAIDEPEKAKGAVSIRASIKPDHLISMLDGKPYKMLKRHLSLRGYTPQTYRATFGLPLDYPMTAAAYTEFRRGMAKKIGLGRTPAIAQPPVKPPRKTRARKESSPVAAVE